MNYSFHPDAELEFNQTIDYYEEISSELAYDFAIEIYSTIQRSITMPKAWPVLEGEIRRALVNRCPYGVLYSEENKGIYIIAVMHLHRSPEYWKYRK